MISPWDNQIIGEFTGTYKVFMDSVSGAFVSEELIVSLYNKLIEKMSKVLFHYVDVSMTCRKFYNAYLNFEQSTQEYNRVLPFMHKLLSVTEYAEVVTLYTDIKLSFDQCCMPEPELMDKFSETLSSFTTQLSGTSKEE